MSFHHYYELRGNEVFADGQLVPDGHLGVVFSVKRSMVLKHGTAAAVSLWWTCHHKGVSTRFNDSSLVACVFDARVVGTVWLTAALNGSGSITALVRGLLSTAQADAQLKNLTAERIACEGVLATLQSLERS